MLLAGVHDRTTRLPAAATKVSLAAVVLDTDLALSTSSGSLEISHENSLGGGCIAGFNHFVSSNVMLRLQIHLPVERLQKVRRSIEATYEDRHLHWSGPRNKSRASR
jgi:hypothetical protein